MPGSADARLCRRHLLHGHEPAHVVDEFLQSGLGFRPHGVSKTGLGTMPTVRTIDRITKDSN